jgi:hypothetical protein
VLPATRATVGCRLKSSGQRASERKDDETRVLLYTWMASPAAGVVLFLGHCFSFFLYLYAGLYACRWNPPISLSCPGREEGGEALDEDIKIPGIYTRSDSPRKEEEGWMIYLSLLANTTPQSPTAQVTCRMGFYCKGL